MWRTGHRGRCVRHASHATHGRTVGVATAVVCRSGLETYRFPHNTLINLSGPYGPIKAQMAKCHADLASVVCDVLSGHLLQCNSLKTVNSTPVSSRQHHVKKNKKNKNKNISVNLIISQQPDHRR